MNLKNHTTPRYWELTGDRGETVTYAHSTTFKWNLKDIPFVTRNMCNYLVGLLVFVTVNCTYTRPEGDAELLDEQDVARGLFESAEVQQTMFGTPVSANHFLGKYFSLFGFVANGMRGHACQPLPIATSTAAGLRTYSYFVPLSALHGMKGHHTAQPVVCYDRAQLILRTAASGAVDGFTVTTNVNNTIRVVAVVNPEPELRLGPGTSLMRYTQNASTAGTIINVDALGNSSTLEGVEPGAGLAWFAWMGGAASPAAGAYHQFGGAGNAGLLEYLSVPFRDVQMIRNLEAFVLDWMDACGGTSYPYSDADSGGVAPVQPVGGGHQTGYLFPCWKQHGETSFVQNAEFLPIITPHRFLEVSKLQVVQGTQSLSLKSSGGFAGEHVFCAHQYHSWTPAKQEEVFRKLVDTGVAKQVWGRNDLVPKIKVANKQPTGSLNPTKSRFFALTWQPPEAVTAAPSN